MYSHLIYVLRIEEFHSKKFRKKMFVIFLFMKKKNNVSSVFPSAFHRCSNSVNHVYRHRR